MMNKTFHIFITFFFFLKSYGQLKQISTGSNAQKAILAVQALFLPFKLLLISDQYDPALNPLKGKQAYDNQYFICKSGTCSAPYSNLNDFLTTINQTKY